MINNLDDLHKLEPEEDIKKDKGLVADSIYKLGGPKFNTLLDWKCKLRKILDRKVLEG
jgi:hypothetical protein